MIDGHKICTYWESDVASVSKHPKRYRIDRCMSLLSVLLVLFLELELLYTPITFMKHICMCHLWRVRIRSSRMRQSDT